MIWKRRGYCRGIMTIDKCLACEHPDCLTQCPYGVNYSKRHRDKNKDKISKYLKKYKADNKESIKEYFKEYGIKNRDKIRKQKEKYRADNREKFREYTKKWRASKCLA